MAAFGRAGTGIFPAPTAISPSIAVGAGKGIFPAPTAIEGEIEAQYNVRVVGRLPEVRERFYVISAERKIKNPIVSAVTSAARRKIFEGGTRD